MLGTLIYLLAASVLVHSCSCMVPGVNFTLAYRIYKIGFDEQLKGIDQIKLVSRAILEEAEHVVSMLEECHKFDLARQLSQVGGLDVGLVTVEEVQRYKM